MKNGFDYSEFIKYMNNFEKMTVEFETFLKNFLLQQAQRCVASTKRKTPVDTGFLRENWIIGDEAKAIHYNPKTDKYTGNYDSAFVSQASIDSIKVVGNTLEVTISNGAEYASYVEYGHKSTGGNWIQGRFMLTISIDEVERAMPARFKKAFEQFIKERGV